MARTTTDKARAYRLYCEGIPQEQIALAIGAGPRTIARWIVKYNWKDDREKDAVVVRENGKNDREKLNDNLLNSVKKVWAKSVTDGTARASAGDLVKVVTLERLVAGESTENVAIMSHVSIGQAYKEFLEKEAKEKEDN